MLAAILAELQVAKFLDAKSGVKKHSECSVIADRVLVLSTWGVDEFLSGIEQSVCLLVGESFPAGPLYLDAIALFKRNASDKRPVAMNPTGRVFYRVNDSGLGLCSNKAVGVVSVAVFGVRNGVSSCLMSETPNSFLSASTSQNVDCGTNPSLSPMPLEYPSSVRMSSLKLGASSSKIRGTGSSP